MFCGIFAIGCVLARDLKFKWGCVESFGCCVDSFSF